MSGLTPPKTVKQLVLDQEKISGSSVKDLVNAIRRTFGKAGTIQKLVYARGEDLYIEREVDTSPEGAEDPLAGLRETLPGVSTPIDYLRNNAKILEIPDAGLSLISLAQCASVIHQRGKKVTALLTNDPRVFRRIGVDVGSVWDVPVLSSSDCPEHMVFVAGSAQGSEIKDIQLAVMVRLED